LRNFTISALHQIDVIRVTKTKRFKFTGLVEYGEMKNMSKNTVGIPEGGDCSKPIDRNWVRLYVKLYQVDWTT
jgi:hypothetical protein